jgi:hypothetical protein
MRHHNVQFMINLSIFICSLFFALDLSAQSNTPAKSFFVYQDINVNFKTQTTLSKINKENTSVVYAVISDDCTKCFEDLKVLSAIIKSKKHIKFYSIQDHLNAEKEPPIERFNRYKILLRNASEYGIDAQPTPLILPIKFNIQDILDSLKLNADQADTKKPFYILCENNECELFDEAISDDYSIMQKFFEKIDQMPEAKQQHPISPVNQSASKDDSFDWSYLIPIIIICILFLIKRGK